ncbi:Ubiquitin-conjugating enzyme E2 15 variant 2 [Rhizophagus irregularis]|uniref:E2 ubiquitin-conjugating protein UBC7 n=1 Tax=Rhizophagus irregularis (strain DAOM 197198w) TaxID=1432141 RepID=A0A015JXR4_RHIIW|nr:E2 ubiquitin-conjugating protein UBC7 [Rhizophagus irregularis DAOM 197198w]UZO29543.1 Ubiquitin-conjugating enzyme E2 15 variant 2 [Rhizophagus irregularis]
MASPATTLQSALLLQKQLKELSKHPVEGFSAGLVDNDNIYEWEIMIIGPPDTLYEGGFFKARMTFPKDYPLMPPKLRFISEMWHPNVYPDGEVCISILVRNILNPFFFIVYSIYAWDNLIPLLAPSW